GVSTGPSIPVPQPAQAPAPEPAAHAEAPIAPRPQNIERQASPVQSPKPLPLTPPRAIRQFAPIVRESVRRSIPGEVVIKVRVHIDVAGKVITAESLSKGSPIAEALASSAIAAVKQWQFEPARR